MKYPLVLVTWEDSRQATTAWEFLEDYKDRVPIECKSVGYLLQNNRGGVVVVSNYVPETEFSSEQAANFFVIPKGCVISIKLLNEGAELKSAFKQAVIALEEGAEAFDVPDFLRKPKD